MLYDVVAYEQRSVGESGHGDVCGEEECGGGGGSVSISYRWSKI